MAKIARAKSAQDIYAKKRDLIVLPEPWASHLGNPEIKGSWFVYGHSGNGKTSYLTQMAKMLTQFGKVWYNGLEEGDSLSFQQAMQRAGLGKCGNRFLLIEDTVPELRIRIARRNRPRFLIVESLQVSQMIKSEYHALTKECEEKGIQLIIIGHAEGKQPEGRLGKYIRYLSFIKIWIEGYKAIPVSRYGGKEPYTIYPERANEYWGNLA